MAKRGININLWTSNGYPQDISIFKGIDHVRAVLKRTRPKLGDHRHEILDANTVANLYSNWLQYYVGSGKTVLLIINQETFDNYDAAPPWVPNAQMTWNQYAENWSNFAVEIISKLKPEVFKMIEAVQVWNEPDAEIPHSSVKLEPAQYAILHATLEKKVRAAFPGIKIVTAGFCSGAGSQVAYYKAAQKAVPFNPDFFATHPYGAYLGKRPEIPGDWGTVIQNHINTIASLKLPIWITEWTAYTDDNKPLEFKYEEAAAEYIKSMKKYFYNRPDIYAETYFAWSDSMRNAGIVIDNQKQNRRKKMYEIFLTDNLDSSAPTEPKPPAGSLVVSQSVVNIRSVRAALLPPVATLNKGFVLLPLDHPGGLEYKIGNPNEWIWVEFKLNAQEKRQGFVRGDLVEYVK